jgi:hypothetical protein
VFLSGAILLSLSVAQSTTNVGFVTVATHTVKLKFTKKSQSSAFFAYLYGMTLSRK